MIIDQPFDKYSHTGNRQNTMNSGMSGSGHLQPSPLLIPTRGGSFRGPGDLPKSKRNDLNNSRHNFADNSRRGSLPSSSPNLLSISCDDVRKEEKEVRETSLRRVRSFKTTSKGVVNRGDSFRKKGGRNAPGSSFRENDGVRPLIKPRLVPQTSVNAAGQVVSYFKVVVLGAMGVGKSSITQQFMTSEYIAFDNSMDQSEEITVSVLLNGEESTLEFVDGLESDFDLEDVRADAYLVVFSIAHRDTFDVAVDLLNELRHDLGTDRSTILVGNKCDLVRKRKVKTEEALLTAHQYDAKYTETSAAVNHHIDELLVGLLSQIRYKLNPSLPEPVLKVETKKSSGFSRRSFKAPFDLLSRIFRGGSRKGKSRRDHRASRECR